jgi:hypothetical protein
VIHTMGMQFVEPARVHIDEVDCGHHLRSWLSFAPGARFTKKNHHLMPGTDNVYDSDAKWQKVVMVTDGACPVPVPLGFDMWMHSGDGEFQLTDPTDSSSVTGVRMKRIHDGSCGVMQYEQLESEPNCRVLDKSWSEVLRQTLMASAHVCRRA